MRRWFRRHRLRAASERAERAAREVEVSRERLEKIRAEVVRPLREVGERNQFAAMIRENLMVGRR